MTDDRLYNDLKNHGCIPQKSLIIKFPTISDELVPHFIRGYFDGDGTVGIYKNSSIKDAITLRSGFCSGSKEFIEKLYSYLPVKKATIKKNVRNNNGAGFVYTINFSVNDSLKLYLYMYPDNTNIYLKRKKDIFDDFIKQRRSETIIKTSLSKEERELQTKLKRKEYYEKNKEKIIAQVSERRRQRKLEEKMKE